MTGLLPLEKCRQSSSPCARSRFMIGYRATAMRLVSIQSSCRRWKARIEETHDYHSWPSFSDGMKPKKRLTRLRLRGPSTTLICSEDQGAPLLHSFHKPKIDLH